MNGLLRALWSNVARRRPVVQSRERAVMCGCAAIPCRVRDLSPIEQVAILRTAARTGSSSIAALSSLREATKKNAVAVKTCRTPDDEPCFVTCYSSSPPSFLVLIEFSSAADNSKCSRPCGRHSSPMRELQKIKRCQFDVRRRRRLPPFVRITN